MRGDQDLIRAFQEGCSDLVLFFLIGFVGKFCGCRFLVFLFGLRGGLLGLEHGGEQSPLLARVVHTWPTVPEIKVAPFKVSLRGPIKLVKSLKPIFYTVDRR